MNPQNLHPDAAELDAYLDDQLSPDQRARFEQRLRQDPDLAAQVQRQNAINQSLVRWATPPSPAGVLAAIGHAAPPPAPAAPPPQAAPAPRAWPLSPRMLIGAAAGILLIASILSIWRQVDPESRFLARVPLIGQGTQPAHATLDQVYRQIVADGFRPDQAGIDPAHLDSVLRQRLGHALVLADLPDGVTGVGVRFGSADANSPTVGVMATIDSHPLIVFINRADQDACHGVAPACRLNLFERRMGDLVLREVTPLPEPRLLDLFSPPPAP